MSSENPAPVQGEVVKDSVAIVKTNARVQIGQGVMFQSMAEVFSVADAIRKSGAGPSKATTGMIATAILKGQALGLDPVTSWCNIAVINGRASLGGDVALGVVRRSGLLGIYKREWIGVEGEDSYGCKITMSRKDTGEQLDYTFTFGEAKKAQLLRTAMWTAFTKRMVYYRTLSFVLRDLFSDILNGTYLREEFEAEPGTPQPAGMESPEVVVEADPLFEAPALPADTTPADTLVMGFDLAAGESKTVEVVATINEAGKVTAVQELVKAASPSKVDAVEALAALQAAAPAPLPTTDEVLDGADPFEAAAGKLLAAVEKGELIRDDQTAKAGADPFAGFRDPVEVPPIVIAPKREKKKPAPLPPSATVTKVINEKPVAAPGGRKW